MLRHSCHGTLLALIRVEKLLMLNKISGQKRGERYQRNIKIINRNKLTRPCLKRKTKRQTTVNKTQHLQLKTEQHRPKKLIWGDLRCSWKVRQILLHTWHQFCFYAMTTVQGLNMTSRRFQVY